MKKYLCGFYAEPLNWTVTAENEQSAAATFAEFIKQNGIKYKPGVEKFVIFEVKGN